MRLKRNGWLIWWAWLWEYKPSRSTDVCTVFWRAFLLTPLKLLGILLLATVALGALAAYALEFYRRPGHVGLITGIVVGGIALLIGGLVTLNPNDGIIYELIEERIHDYKAKRCSKIDLI